MPVEQCFASAQKSPFNENTQPGKLETETGLCVSARRFDITIKQFREAATVACTDTDW